MSGFVEWDEVEQPKSGFNSQGNSGNSGKFMKLEPNQTYRVRPVYKPIKFYKYYNRKDGQLRSAVTEDPQNCTVKAKYPDLKPQTRYACLVFDRNDENKLKILEGPQSLFNVFKHFKKVAQGAEPGGKDGGDFQIIVHCPNGKKDRNTTYECEFIENVSFTQEEKDFVKQHKEEYDLEQIFAAQSPEEIEKRLFDEGSDDTQSSSNTESSGNNMSMEGAAAQTSSSEEDDDELFNF
jgi:hypothetical protein